METGLDLDRLLKLRLVVARHGEMDRAAWWNTNGMLGRYGAIALKRGLPRTYRFAQARGVFAVARSRCREVFDAPGSVTLWSLPATVEDQFEEHWQNWLGQPERWNTFFDALASAEPSDLLAGFAQRDLITPGQAENVKTMRRSAEGRAVQLSGYTVMNDELLTLLAAGFAKGEQGAPAIPFAKLDE
jgi:hypothetical protein